MAVSDVPPSARSNRRLAGWLGFIGALTLLNYVSRAAAGAPDRDVFYRWETFGGALFQFGLMLVIVWAIALRGPARDLFALRAPERWVGALLIGILTLLATLVVGGAVSVFGDAEREQGLVPDHWDGDRAAPFVANFLLVSTLVPVVEELSFRGLGFTLLSTRMRSWATVLVIGCLFGLAHGLLLGLPILAVFGIGLAALRAWTRSVYPCIVLHAFFNGASLLISVTIGSA
jgi:membrane protease YdiL (CAAX protease family)